MILAAMFFATVTANAQQCEVKVKKDADQMHINIVKEHDGQTIVIDTVIDPENFDPQYFKEKYGIDILVNQGGLIKEFEGKDGEHTIEIMVESDVEEGTKSEEIEMNVFVTDDGEQEIIMTKKGANVIKIKGDEGEEGKIIIKKIEGDENAEIIFITDEIELKEGEEGHKVIEVECCDGKTIVKSKILILDLLNEDEALENNDLKEELIIDSESELEVTDLKFYPNPTTGLVKFSFATESDTPVDIKVFDIKGKVIYSETVTDFKGNYEKEIDLSAMKKGTYFLKITQNGQAETKKIILN